MKVKLLCAIDIRGKPHVLEWRGEGEEQWTFGTHPYQPELGKAGLDGEQYMQVWIGECVVRARDGEEEEEYVGVFHPLTMREWEVIKRGHSEFFEECP
jgi:hypothetical protein